MLWFVGWGSTYGAIQSARPTRARMGTARWPRPPAPPEPAAANLGEVSKRFDQVLVPELNLGQLATVLRADAISWM